MAEDMEILATSINSGRYERDLRALQWTVVSLTEDREFEPFVEGVSELLSDSNREKSLASWPGMPNVMQDLVFYEDADLLARIVRLLMSCEVPGALADESRRKRAIVCMDAIASLFHILDFKDSRCHAFLLSGAKDLARILSKLQNDKVLEVASSANFTTTIVIDNLHTVIVAAMAPSTTPSTRAVVGDTQDILVEMLEALDVLDSIHPIFDMIVTIAPLYELSCRSTRICYSYSPHSNYAALVEILRDSYFPRYLDTFCRSGVLVRADGQKRVIACMKAIQATGAHSRFPGVNPKPWVSTACSLRALKASQIPATVHYANQTIARLACHLQSDIVSNFGVDGGIHWALDTLPVLDNLDSAVLPDLRRQLLLRHPNSHSQSLISGGDLHGLWENLEREFSTCLSQMSAYESERLKKFQSCTTKVYKHCLLDHHPTSRLSVPQKIILSRGQVVVLIAFLHSMKALLPAPDEVLELSLDTLQLITKNLSARFSSHLAQAFLIELVGTIIKSLNTDFTSRTSPDMLGGSVRTEVISVVTSDNHPELISQSRLDITSLLSFNEFLHPGPRKIITKMIQTLFDVLSTIADATCIDDAKAIAQAVIDDPAASDAARQAAQNTLQKASL
jgi:hypothetical protein